MTFLTPIPALIAAALAVPALLIFYFLKLRRRPLRVSSTLLWQQATRDLQVNVPLRLIRPSWLLALQLLILALLLLAMARPAIGGGFGAHQRIILLIDRSASMSATDSPPSGRPRLDEARELALALLDGLGRAGATTAVAVVAFSHEPTPLSNLSTDLAAARAAVRAIEPTDQPADLDAALRLAGALLAADADEQDRDAPGLVALFSDGGSTLGRGFALAGAELRYERIGPADPQPDNLGIAAISARRDYEDPASLRIFARIVNASDHDLTATIALAMDGRTVERRAVRIPGPQDGRPGQAPITFETRAHGSGLATITIERPDTLAADNAASLWIAPATRARIVLVYPDPPPPDPASPDDPAAPPDPHWLIADVLREMRLQSFRAMTASEFSQGLADSAAIVTGADLIVFDRVRPAVLPDVPTLSFGAGLPIRGLRLAEPSPDALGSYFLTWDRAHPILRDVSLDTIYIARPMPISLDDADRPDAPSPPSLTELAHGAGDARGALIALLEHDRTRRLLVGFEVIQSNWPVHVGFPIFLASAVDYLTLRSLDRAGSAFTTSQPVEIETPGPGRILLRGPIDIALDRPPGPSALVGILPRAGVYEATIGGSPVPPIPVNLAHADESAIRIADSIRIAGESVEGGGAGPAPRELWPLFVIAALALLAFEWLLNAWLMRV